MDDRSVVISYGRMNPPTWGHGRIIELVLNTALKLSADHEIILSHKFDNDRNPLELNVKIAYLRQIFPNVNFVLASRELPTIGHHVKVLSETYKHLTIVCGADRVREFSIMLDKFNDRDFNFSSYAVLSAGDRSSTDNISSTDMRKFVMDGDLYSFLAGLPLSTDPLLGVSIFEDVRSSLINTGNDNDRKLTGANRKAKTET